MTPTGQRSDDRVEQLLEQYRERQPQVLSAAAGVALLGAILIYLGIRDSGVSLGLLGFALVTAGLFPLNDRVRIETRRRPRLWLGVGFGLLVLAALLVWAALSTEWAWLASIGAVAGVLGLLPFGSYLRLNSVDVGGRWTIVGLVVVLAGIVAAGFGVNWLLVSVVVLAGITAYRTGLTGWLGSQGAVRFGVIAGGTGVVLGTIAVIAGAQTSSLVLFFVGALPGTLALHLLSVTSTTDAAERWKKQSPLWQRFARPVRLATALALVLTWIAIITIGDQPPALGTALALAGISIGAAFVWRGESILIVLLFGFLVVWVSIDRDVAPLPEPASGQPRIVALGDSYMSGEGALEFFEHTNVAGSKSNQCRRAPTAYPVLVAEARGVGLQFLACSGAKAAELHLDGQMPNATDDAPGRLPQLDYVDFDEDIDLILVSVGGNDARFSSVGKGCLLPGSCSELEENWIKNVEALSDELVPAYQAIRDRAGPDTPIVAMPYPIMVTERGCREAMLDDDEHSFVVRFVTAINAQVALSAKQAGIHFFAGGIDAYIGDRICSQGQVDPSAVNFISLQPTEGPFVDRLNPANWVHGSLHPNAGGHGRVAAALVAWLDMSPPGVNPAPEPGATLADVGIETEPAPASTSTAVLPDETEWRNEQLAAAAKEAWPAVVLLFLGGWLFAATGKGGPFRRAHWTTDADLAAAQQRRHGT